MLPFENSKFTQIHETSEVVRLEMDWSRNGMENTQANEDNTGSHGAMISVTTSNQPVESLLDSSMAVHNRAQHASALNQKIVGTSLLEYTNSQRRQQINPSLLAQLISVNLSELLIGTTGSQRNHAPLFPSEELMHVASLLRTSSHHQSLSTLPGPFAPADPGQQRIAQQQMAAIFDGLPSKGEITRIGMNGVMARLRDLATPTFDRRHTENGSALSQVAPTSKHRRNIDRGESRTECAQIALSTKYEDGLTAAGLDALRGIFGHRTPHVLEALVDSTDGRFKSVHDLDTVRIELETSSGKSEESTGGPAGRGNGDTCNLGAATASSTHCKACRPIDTVPPNQTSEQYEPNDEDQRYPTAASAKKSHVKFPDTNKNVEESTNPFLLPCRARGMPTDHNFRNAHFVIPGNVRHGEELICSYQECRNAGIKFQYCASCRIPVAKRNFNQRHNHGLYDMAVHGSKAIVVPPLVPSAIVADSMPHASSRDLYTRQKGTSARTEHDDRSTMVSGQHGETRDLKKRQRCFEVVESCHPGFLEPIPDISRDRQMHWLTLLNSRPNIDDSELMSAWLIEVMAVSDLQRALPQTLPDGSMSTTSALGARTSIYEGFGALVSDTSTGATMSSLTSSARVQDDPGEIDHPAQSVVPNDTKNARVSGRKTKRRLMSTT